MKTLDEIIDFDNALTSTIAKLIENDEIKIADLDIPNDFLEEVIQYLWDKNLIMFYEIKRGNDFFLKINGVDVGLSKDSVITRTIRLELMAGIYC